jgi:hypothetical protein
MPNLLLIKGDIAYRYVDGKYTKEKVQFDLSLGTKQVIKDLNDFREFGFEQDVGEHQ